MIRQPLKPCPLGTLTPPSGAIDRLAQTMDDMEMHEEATVLRNVAQRNPQQMTGEQLDQSKAEFMAALANFNREIERRAYARVGRGR